MAHTQASLQLDFGAHVLDSQRNSVDRSVHAGREMQQIQDLGV